jgi:hypothetical protein
MSVDPHGSPPTILNSDEIHLAQEQQNEFATLEGKKLAENAGENLAPDLEQSKVAK